MRPQRNIEKVAGFNRENMINFLLLLLTSTTSLFFFRANSAYEAGDFETAIAFYDSALTLFSAPEIYYNRGNAYFKQGRLGKALADYLRAYALKPTDPDIKNNIAFLRQFRPDKVTNPPNPLGNLIRTIFVIIDSEKIRLINGLLFLLLSIILGLFFLLDKRVFGIISLGIALLFLYSLISILIWNGLVNPNQAVVIAPEATLRSGPGGDYKEIAVVHDGLEVKIIERRPEYILIQIPGGTGGWVEKGTIEQVFSTR